MARSHADLIGVIKGSAGSACFCCIVSAALDDRNCVQRYAAARRALTTAPSLQACKLPAVFPEQLPAVVYAALPFVIAPYSAAAELGPSDS